MGTSFRLLNPTKQQSVSSKTLSGRRLGALLDDLIGPYDWIPDYDDDIVMLIDVIQ